MRIKLFYTLFKNYAGLILYILIALGVLIVLTSVIDFFYFQQNFYLNIIFDLFFGLLITFIFLIIIFSIINKKEIQLTEQIDQLTDAYKYIGQINRKIDSLLELDISYLDRSKKHSGLDSFKSIFNQLVNLVQAEAAYLYLKPPFNFKISTIKQNNNKINNLFNKLAKNIIKDFKYSVDDPQYFKNLDIAEGILNKYDLLIKPVYMHDQDIGSMFLVFNKKNRLEERDLNIIRVFSFYLALNATFRPDFSIYRT